MKSHSTLKAIVSLLLIMSLAVFFAVGCSGNSGQNTNEPGDSEVATEYAPVELNLCHFMSAMHPLHAQIFVPFAEAVEEKTEGRVKIYCYASNELVAADKNYDAVLSGVIDIGCTLPAYTPGYFPLTSILEFPFMFTSPMQSNLTAGEFARTNPILRETEYKDVELLWWGTTDLGHFLLKKPINGISDLKGMKMRSPSTVGNDVLNALGAVPITLPVSDTYDAIERSIVDGTMLPISTLITFNLADVVSDVIEMNMYATPLHLVMNKSSWAKISPGDQQIMLDLLAEFPDKIGEVYTKEDAAGRQKANDSGIPIHVPSADEMQKFRDAVDPLVVKWLDDMNAKGVPGWDVYNQIKSIAEKYE